MMYILNAGDGIYITVNYFRLCHWRTRVAIWIMRTYIFLVKVDLFPHPHPSVIPFWFCYDVWFSTKTEKKLKQPTSSGRIFVYYTNILVVCLKQQQLDDGCSCRAMMWFRRWAHLVSGDLLGTAFRTVYLHIWTQALHMILWSTESPQSHIINLYLYCILRVN